MSILDGCPTCASPLVQPHGWRDEGVAVSCPDCHTCARVPVSPEELASLDALQRERRAALRDAYERMVAESMEELADRFAAALASDLIGPDDFAPGCGEAGPSRER